MQQSFPRSMASLEKVFLFVETSLSSLGASPAAGYAINLAVEEIFTNVAKYGQLNDGMVVISIEKRGGAASVTLQYPEDDPFDLTKAPLADTSLPLEDRKPGGLGIYLTREMVDDLQYRYADQVSTVTFTKLLDT